MTTTLIIQGPQTTPAQVRQLAASLSATLEQRGDSYRLDLPARLDNMQLQQLRADHPYDINQLPDGFDPSQIRLLVTDMDSTLINIECIDEIADFLNLKPRIAEITESAMRGEIDFETSLRRRISLLIGLDDSALHHVYQQRLQPNPGAREMLTGLKARGIQTALVSGGFTYFTERLKQRLGLDYTLANVLAFDAHGKLSGLGNEVIVGAERKAQFLLELCNELDISPQQTIAMGDGANDLKMMAVAGLSIAYHAKPAVQQQADCALNHCGLDGVLGLLDITL